MKKNGIILGLAILAGTVTFTSCDDDDKTDNGTDVIINDGAITEREADYLLAASEVLRNDCLTLWASWEGGTGEEMLMEEIELEIGTPYATEYKLAGNAGSRYLSQIDAVDEIQKEFEKQATPFDPTKNVETDPEPISDELDVHVDEETGTTYIKTKPATNSGTTKTNPL